jgi:RND superfamily putative drug exporter
VPTLSPITRLDTGDVPDATGPAAFLPSPAKPTELYGPQGEAMPSSLSHRLTGRRSAIAVLLFWLLAAALSGPLAGKLTGAQKNDSRSWLPASAESTAVLDVQQSFQSPDAYAAVIVYHRDGGLTAPDRAKAAADVPRLAALRGVQGRPSGPAPSPDGTALQTVVTVDLGANGWKRAADVADRMREIAGGAPGLAVHVTGPLGYAADSADAFDGIDSTLLYATIAVVVGILLVTYRSPVLWVLPVLSAGVALTLAQATVYLLARHAGLTVTAQSAGILTVLVMGAGTDYALLLTARYREELRRHADRRTAMAVALRRAAPAILASAATVAAGMLCLLAAETTSTRSLGPVAAVGITVAVVVSTTLLPALLVTCGRWVFWPFIPAHGSAEPTVRGLWARAGLRIARRPRAVWVATALVLGGLSAGMVGLHASGLSNADSFVGRPDSVAGQDVVAAHFPAAGSGSPAAVVAAPAAIDAVRAAVAETEGIGTVGTATVRGGHAYVEALLADPPDSRAAYATVDRLRKRVHALPEADALVGGATAINLDLQRAARHDRTLIIPVVLAVVAVILMVLLRALVAPLLLIATVVLSLGATLGASALIFDHVLGFAGADSALPLFVFVFLVALGIDYNIFLMTRVHEESKQRGTWGGALTGLAATGGVITSAGAVLAGTFAVLATLPLVFLVEVGVAVALGVLLDTLVVRPVLVTALTLDFGRHIWWPSALSRKHELDPDALLPRHTHTSVGSA